MKKFIIIVLIIIVCIVLLFVCAFDTRLKTVNYTLKSEKVSESAKLVFIADLHCCTYGENQSEILRKIEKYNPDAILLGGDIFDDVYINDNSNILIDNIADKYKTYYVSGNHEWWSGEMNNIFNYLKRVGVIVLRGDSDTIEIDGRSIVISGVDDPEVDTYDKTFVNFKKQLDRVGSKVDNDNFNLLLTHRPELAEEYFNYDFDLVLSGHAHGGQGRIPFVLNGLFAPNQGFFPKLAGGKYDFEKGTMVVSRGLSRENTTLPRIFNRPELVFITVKNK